MSHYKQLYKHLASATDTFTLFELAAMITSLSWYNEQLHKLPDFDSDIKIKGEIEAVESSLKKVKALYEKSGGPHLS